MLDGEQQIVVDRHPVGDAAVVVGVGGELVVAGGPGAVEHALAGAFADLVAQDAQQRQVAVGTVQDGVVAGVVRDVLEVGLARADDESVQPGEPGEDLTEHQAVDLLGERPDEVDAARAVEELVAVQLHEALGQHDDVGEVIRGEAGGVGAGDAFVDVAGGGLDPGAAVGTGREDPRVDGVEGDGGVRRTELVDDLPVVSVVGQQARVVEAALGGRLARVALHHVEQERKSAPAGRGGAHGGVGGGGSGDRESGQGSRPAEQDHPSVGVQASVVLHGGSLGSSDGRWLDIGVMHGSRFQQEVGIYQSLLFVQPLRILTGLQHASIIGCHDRAS
ncbi:hypothetical protein ACFXDF_11550 [Streptomyces sp. NPDC059426]|uniref:hypothetical protein n=1 Tax=Streptomyces sp. NPDC059426 TaxID=3346827 RepID=UPI0036AD8DDE